MVHCGQAKQVSGMISHESQTRVTWAYYLGGGEKKLLQWTFILMILHFVVVVVVIVAFPI